MKIHSYFIDDDHIWAYIINKGRGCWWGIDVEEVPEFEDDLDVAYNDEEKTKEILMVQVKNAKFDPAKLPHIEDEEAPFRSMWYDITISENNMVFIDEPTNEEEEEVAPWHDFGIPREEYEAIIDAAIEKYGLSDIVIKHEGPEILYTCYGNFQSCFSENVEGYYGLKL